MDKGYIEPNVSDIVKFSGGEKKLKEMFNKSEDAYRYLWTQYEKWANSKFESGYSEVGELDPTQLVDWCDNIWRG